MRQPAGEDNRRNPNQKCDERDEGPAREEDRQRRQEEGEDVVHGRRNREAGRRGQGWRGGNSGAASGGCGGWNAAGKWLESGLPVLRGFLTTSGQDGGIPDMEGRDSVEDRMRTIAQERAHLEMMRGLETWRPTCATWSCGGADPAGGTGSRGPSRSGRGRRR